MRHNPLDLDGRTFERFSETHTDAHLVALDEGRERNRATAKRRGQPASGEIGVNGGLHGDVLPVSAASTYHLLNQTWRVHGSPMKKREILSVPDGVAACLNPLDILANAFYGFSMIPKSNREVTAEEMLEQCRRNRQEARILENRDRTYEIEPLPSGLRISAPVLIRAKSKAS